MTGSAETTRYAVDTSVAVAALDAAHTVHEDCLREVRGRRPALAGHVAFEVFSVLTRMPGQLEVDPADLARIIGRVFPEIVWLAPADAASLFARLHVLGITGGGVYDALVGEAARTNRRHLLTRDGRARRTYDLLGIEYTVIGP